MLEGQDLNKSLCDGIPLFFSQKLHLGCPIFSRFVRLRPNQIDDVSITFERALAKSPKLSVFKNKT